MRDDETLRLLAKRAWLNRHIEKAMLKRRYPRLPEGHPLFDADDLPHWWQRWAAEGVGAVILVAFMVTVAYLTTFIPPISPILDALAAAIG